MQDLKKKRKGNFQHSSAPYLLYELMFVCSASHWVVSFSDEVLWERKHVVLQFPVCGPDNMLWCVTVCY